MNDNDNEIPAAELWPLILFRGAYRNPNGGSPTIASAVTWALEEHRKLTGEGVSRTLSIQSMDSAARRTRDGWEHEHHVVFERIRLEGDRFIVTEETRTDYLPKITDKPRGQT